jgi:hypothetical protein
VQLELDFSARAREITPTRRHLPLVLDPIRLPADERIALMQGRLEYARELDALEACRPKTRADCADVPRPCPFVACRYNLFLDVDERGVVTIPRSDVPPEEREQSCALDVVEKNPDGIEAGEVAELLGLSRELVGRIEERGQAAVARDRDLAEAHEHESAVRPARDVAAVRRQSLRRPARPSPTSGNVRGRLSAALREQAILDALVDGPKTTAELVERLRGTTHPAGYWWVRHVCRTLRARERVTSRMVRVAGQDAPVIEWNTVDSAALAMR